MQNFYKVRGLQVQKWLQEMWCNCRQVSRKKRQILLLAVKPGPAPRPSAPKCQDCDRIFKPCVQTVGMMSTGDQGAPNMASRKCAWFTTLAKHGYVNKKRRNWKNESRWLRLESAGDRRFILSWRNIEEILKKYQSILINLPDTRWPGSPES